MVFPPVGPWTIKRLADCSLCPSSPNGLKREIHIFLLCDKKKVSRGQTIYLLPNNFTRTRGISAKPLDIPVSGLGASDWARRDPSKRVHFFMQARVPYRGYRFY
jgi:hypothetical protein